MVDIDLMSAVPTDAERAAVDGFLGSPDSGWDGGHRRPETDGHFASSPGFRANRHLLLPAFHAVQDELGWVSPGALNYVCERLDVPPAEAYGVATFYALVATEERPLRAAHVCDDVPCRLGGATDLIRKLDAAGIDWEASDDVPL